MESSLTVTQSARTYPKHPYLEMKNAILGKSYMLSLVFVGKTRAQALNKKYLGKMYIPNVLSFELGKNVGEIFITPSVAKQEAPKRNMTESQYIGFLFIHGLLHLKGYAHGDNMDKAEEKYMAQFNLR